MRSWRRTFTNARGYSVIETMFVVAGVGVLLGTAALFSPDFLRVATADSGLQQLMDALRHAREQAIAERRNIELRFVGNNRIQLVRRDVTGLVENGTTVLDTITLEGDVRFGTLAGTSDLSGADNLVAGLGSNGINTGTTGVPIFTSEGTLVDQAGDPLNVELFIVRGSDLLSSRAATIFGPTALVRGYRWDGRAWGE
jgi:Tfp pilus assembly protein FimT